MSIHRLPQSDSTVRTEASAWIAQLDKGNLTPADLRALCEWMRRSPRHTQELRLLARLSGELDVLTQLAGPLREASRSYYMRGLRATPLPWFVSAALFAGLMVGLVLMRDAVEPPAEAWSQTVVTAVGEQREVKLLDGSVITLNTDSQLNVNYGAGYRNVRLLQGEVMFDVARDPDRPFVVDAGLRRIEAVGTAFAVRIEPDSVAVIVTEGRVRVFEPPPDDKSAAPVNSPILLDSGKRIVIVREHAAPQPDAEPVSSQEIQRQLAWREGLLDFSETPLHEVIREVSRHTSLKIEVSDPSLRTLEFNGLFRTGDTATLFMALKTSFGIDARYIEADTVALSRGTQPRHSGPTAEN